MKLQHIKLLLLSACTLSSFGAAHSQIATATPLPHWIGSWAASQQIVEPQNSIPAATLHDITLRQTVHLSAGGKTVRVHLSNAFGATPLHLTSVHIARPVALGAIDPATDRPLTFSGREEVLIPPGAEYIADPIDYPSAALSDVAVTMHIEAVPGQQTGHPGSRATSYVAPSEKTTSVHLAGATTLEHWYFLSGIDVAAGDRAYSVVALGDSITDGHGATTNGNDRWPDVVASRLQASPSTQSIGILNQGIGGNHLLTDGLGPNVLARFDRDVLAQTGARTVIVLEGINDLGSLARMENVTGKQHEDLVERMIGAYEQIVARAHTHGLRVIGATILPDTGSDYYHPGPADEADRQTINQWIRVPGHFDALVDLERIMKDPQDSTRLLPAYDSGDHLHPGPAGYRVMGEAVAQALLNK